MGIYNIDGNIVSNDGYFVLSQVTDGSNLFNSEGAYRTLGNLNTGVGGFVENSSGGRMASTFIPVSANVGYYLSVEKLVTYLGGNYFYVVLYDTDKQYLSRVNFDSTTRDYSAEYTFAKFTPTDDGYLQLIYTESSIENIMMTIGESYVPYTPYGSKYMLDVSEEYKEGFLKNLGIISDYKEIIPFTDLDYTDENNIASVVENHVKNGKNALKLSTSSKEYVAVDFGEVNLVTNKKNFGYWMWVDGKTVGSNANATQNGKGSIKFTIGNYSVERSDVCLNAGMHYYIIPLDKFDSEVIGDLKIEIKSGTGNEVSFYLDSIQFGYKVKPHIIFNFDDPMASFTSMAKPIFETYGFKASFQHHIRENGAPSPSITSNEDALTHLELITEGYEYAIYSLYNGDYHTTGQPTDYDTDYESWLAHFKQGMTTNNNFGIFAPSFLNANFHYWGDAYCKAGRDAGFLGVRGNRVQLDLAESSVGAIEKAMFSNFDDEYRHVTPFFFAGAEAGTDQETKTKGLIDRAIELGQNILFSGHGVVEDGSATGTMYESVSFINNILSYVKEKVDNGECVCTTWMGYIKDERPGLYAEWVEKKSRAEHNFIMNKMFVSTT